MMFLAIGNYLLIICNPNNFGIEDTTIFPDSQTIINEWLDVYNKMKNEKLVTWRTTCNSTYEKQEDFSTKASIFEFIHRYCP